jgi:hypothetical protein
MNVLTIVATVSAAAAAAAAERWRQHVNIQNSCLQVQYKQQQHQPTK